MPIPILNENEVLEKIYGQSNPFFEEYFAYYSSLFGGITENPRWMLLPIDDHMVHRGDGVFEAMKAEGRVVYQLDEHLARLLFSANQISIQSPYTLSEIKEIILETLRVADRDNATIRVFLSRGPGDFSANPYDSKKPQLYVVVTKLKPPATDKYNNGVIIGKSHIPIKSMWMTQVKSCNYLPNVMMKKEAIDRKLDFVIGVDEAGHITESATENILIIDDKNRIIQPRLDAILKGLTMMRMCELANKSGMCTLEKSITVDDLMAAREVIITGTSLNVLPVVRFEQHQIGNGHPGPMAIKLNQLIIHDIKEGQKGTPY